jgi:uncharacterized metal-binding protein YceD (DUF177 family)
VDLKKGLVHLQQLRREAIEHRFSSKAPEAWLTSALVNAAPAAIELSPEEWAAKVEIEGMMKLERLDPEYMLEGNFEARVPTTCSRCGDVYQTERQADFRLFYKPKEKTQYNQKDDFSDDPDYTFLESEYIKLGEVLCEQIVVQEPLAECPDRLEDGTCKLCAKNPHFEVES